MVPDLLSRIFTMARAMVDVSASLESAPRLASLDAMRGLTVAAMIVVNNPGSWTAGYAPLVHARWNGWTLADLVFPFFLLIVGVSLDLALAKQGRAPGRGRFAPLPALGKRAALLCALGLLLNAFPYFADLGSLRLFGVLQRIGLCSFAAGAVVLAIGARGQAAVTVAVLVGYWAVLTSQGTVVPTPDDNLAGRFDARWFGGHLYRDTFDPEGLVSTLPAVGTVLLGALAGRFLRQPIDGAVKTAGLVVGGTVLAVAGQLGDAWFPINKQLWTSTFVLLSGGLGLVTLAVCHELVDRRGWRRGGAPFAMLGKNALAIYLLSSLGARLLELCSVGDGESCAPLRLFLYERLFAPWAGAEAGSLAFALAYLAVWMIPTAELHRRRLFFRV
jgi:predicted acyltransferase